MSNGTTTTATPRQAARERAGLSAEEERQYRADLARTAEILIVLRRIADRVDAGRSNRHPVTQEDSTR